MIDNQSNAQISNCNLDIDRLADKLASAVVQRLLEYQQRIARNPAQLLKEINVTELVTLAKNIKDLIAPEQHNGRRRRI